MVQQEVNYRGTTNALTTVGGVFDSTATPVKHASTFDTYAISETIDAVAGSSSFVTIYLLFGQILEYNH